MRKYEPIRNLYSQVVDSLGRQIISGELPVGQILPREDVLAGNMAVSRTVLRESLKVLASKGLIESRQKAGTRVRETRHWHQLDADVLAWRSAEMPTAEFIDHLVEMRELIEPAAASAAAKRHSCMQLIDMENAYASMVDARNCNEWTKADLAFHESILDAANNPLMKSLFAVIENVLGAYFEMAAALTENYKYSIPLHFNVLSAIRDRDQAGARQAMQTLIDDSRTNLVGRLDMNKRIAGRATTS